MTQARAMKREEQRVLRQRMTSVVAHWISTLFHLDSRLRLHDPTGREGDGHRVPGQLHA